MHKIVHGFIDNQSFMVFLLCMDCAASPDPSRGGELRLHNVSMTDKRRMEYGRCGIGGMV